MNSNFGKVVMVILTIIVAYAAIHFVVGLVTGLLSILMPVLIVGGVVYVLYSVYGRKSLGGGRRTLP